MPAAADLSARAFEFRYENRADELRWHARIELPRHTDPAGSFVAELDGQLVGVAQALVRDRIWCLSTLAVDPGCQSGGVGRALLAAALQYGGAERPGLIMASDDPRALRLYARAGFSLRPALEAIGAADRGATGGRDPELVEATAADLGSLQTISRSVRGGTHASEIEHAMALGDRVLWLPERGFAVVRREHGPWLLAARDEDAAAALLRAALAEPAPAVRIRWLVGQDWAVSVALDAGLELRPFGTVCVRGDPGPLHPYLPSGAYC